MFDKLFKIFKIEAVRYLFIGGCTTAVNFIVFAFFRNILNLDLNLSNFIAILSAIIFAFFTNKKIVFRANDNSLKQTMNEFVKFISGRIVTMVIEIVGVWFLAEIVLLNEYVSKIIIQIIVLISNYVISKFFVFKNKES